jgi:hypothetical protein
MSKVMERRLQLLLDQERYDRLAQEAEATGRSVASLIREAIDVRFPSGAAERAEALSRFLDLPVDEGEGLSWTEIKAGLDDDLERKLAR